ncbi:MAG: M56 family metallopeptidase [Thermoguttaceae bacterium]
MPADWTTWTVEQRRAVLAHEIAHARSNDFVALLVGQLGLALHFYHPLLHWLIGRLRLEQELAADAMAASVSGGQQQYLTTIAELALRQQDRPLLWPARAFFSTQTTFLRRIAMLRDSKLRFNRLSPVSRLITVGTVLSCGLLVAGLRAPSVSIAAVGANSVRLPAANDSIDTTYVIEQASAIVVMRPAAVFSRPELTALAKLLETSGNVVPKETHLAEFRQITMILPEANIPSGPRELVVLQWIKPIAEEDLAKRLADRKLTVKQHDGKKLYVPSGGGHCVMVCDDYTVVEAGSEQALGVYLAGKTGVLPKWLPAKAWESFRDDHLVIAADTEMMRREMKPQMDYSSPIVQTAFLPISSSLADATGLAAGARLDDKLAFHAWAAAKNADASVSLRRMTEALKTLAEGVVKGLRTPNEAGRQSDRNVAPILLDLANGLLDNIKFQQEGNNVRLQTSVELGKTRLDALMTTIIASTQPPDVHTKNGMMALVEDFFRHNYHDITSRETIQWGEVTKTKEGDFSIRYKFRYSSWHGEPQIGNQVFTFNPKGEFVSVVDAEKHPPASPARVYEIHKKVSDFPNREDLTTPEAAAVSIRRAYVAEGDAAWPRLSVPSLAAQMPGGAAKPLPKEVAKRFLSAEILEVHVWDGTHAVVIAREESASGGDSYMDDVRSTLDAARQKIEQSRSR